VENCGLPKGDGTRRHISGAGRRARPRRSRLRAPSGPSGRSGPAVPAGPGPRLRRAPSHAAGPRAAPSRAARPAGCAPRPPGDLL